LIEQLRLLAALLLLAWTRLTRRRAGVVLVYHRIGVVDGDPDRDLVAALGQTRFDGQLRHLARFYRPVAAEEIQRAAAERTRGGRFPVAVTFDDDLASHIELAAPALSRHRVPATFFLCGASFDGPRPFWWERLQRLADAGRLVEAEREVAPTVQRRSIHELALLVEEMAPEERSRFSARLAELDPGPLGAGLSADDVTGLAGAGFTIGFHTRRHGRLPDLDDVALAEALSEGRSELEQLAKAPIKLLAYPHGRADDRVARAAREAGFSTAFTGHAVPVTPSSNPLLLGRVEPSSGGTFALLLARTLRAAD